MSPRRPSPFAGNALRAVALAAAAVLWAGDASAASASTAVVAGQLSGVPTSPAFKMAVNKGETGAPEATAVGGTPIEHKDKSAVATKKAGQEPAGHAAAGHEEPHPDAHEAPHEVPHEAAGKPAPESKPAAVAKVAEPAPAGDLESLREKLAARLGATSGAGGKFVMKVSSHGESGESVISVARSGAASPMHARRAVAHHGAASASDFDANANIAARGGLSLAPTHWDYEGNGGPEAWGGLKPEYGKCATGSRQSPIDIRGGIAVDLEPIKFDYRPSAFSVIDNGHTVQVNVEPGNAITITGKRYELQQFHFHRPSEERINGRQFDMVAHLVHKDADGRLAVIAVLLDRGSAQALVQTVWNNLPLEKGDEVRAGVKIDLNQLLPSDRRYYTYMGSLTTPPCSEGVLWMVMKQPVPISPEQVSIFAHLYPMNARPIQQASGRLIKESN